MQSSVWGLSITITLKEWDRHCLTSPLYQSYINWDATLCLHSHTRIYVNETQRCVGFSTLILKCIWILQFTLNLTWIGSRIYCLHTFPVTSCALKLKTNSTHYSIQSHKCPLLYQDTTTAPRGPCFNLSLTQEVWPTCRGDGGGQQGVGCGIMCLREILNINMKKKRNRG